MTFRVYLRWPNQRVSDKTVTEDRALAALAYEALRKRRDLIGKPVGVAFTESVGGKSQQIAYHSFEVAAEAEADARSLPASRPIIKLKKARGSPPSD